MDARWTRVIVLLAVCTSAAHGGGHYSRNFVVTAQSGEFAKEICLAAEHYRKSLALAWLGHELPPWHDRCPITVRVAPELGAGGVTSFSFQHNRPFDWRMSIQGSRERILDSVLPHEVTHTIFATHFGRPLPRWADEGACTTVEHDSEKSKHYQHLYRYLTASPNRGIPFNSMFRMTEYPQDIMPLYAQGHSVVEYLVAHRGRRHFVDFLAEGMSHENWNSAIQKWYGFSDLSDLQIRWVGWLRDGRPQLQPDFALAMAATPAAVTAQENTFPHPLPNSPAGIVASGDSEHALLATAAKPAPSNSVVAAGSWYARHHEQAQISLAKSIEPNRPFTPGSTVKVTADGASQATTSVTGPAATSAVDWKAEGQWTSQTYRR